MPTKNTLEMSEYTQLSEIIRMYSRLQSKIFDLDLNPGYNLLLKGTLPHDMG